MWQSDWASYWPSIAPKITPAYNAEFCDPVSQSNSAWRLAFAAARSWDVLEVP
jgi:hypothetical protein